MADRKAWQKRLMVNASRKLRTRTFAAFNTNIDAVVHLSGSELSAAINQAGLQGEPWKKGPFPAMVRTVQDFLRVIYAQLQEGKSCHIVVEGEVINWITQTFPEAAETMGGQAGIIANQMASLGAKSSVYSPLLSPRQARLFDERVEAPVVENGEVLFKPVREAANPQDAVKLNWIFEYAKGEEFLFGTESVVTPRANRVIMATRPKESVMAFSAGFADHLSSLGSQVDVAFMAGYHYAAPEGNGDRDFSAYLAYTKHSLWQLSKRNPNLRIHYEYVPMKHEDLEAEVLTGIGEHIHSLGINENEIRRALRKLGHDPLADAIEESEHAYTLYQGARALLNDLGVERVHVHNLGYYVVAMKRPYPLTVHDALGASLYASAVNALKAKYGGYPSEDQLEESAQMDLSDIGFDQVDRFTAEVGAEGHQVTEGIWEFDDHVALVIPAHVVPKPLSTVGMGDTISSSSFAMEATLAKAMV